MMGVQLVSGTFGVIFEDVNCQTFMYARTTPGKTTDSTVANTLK